MFFEAPTSTKTCFTLHLSISFMVITASSTIGLDFNSALSASSLQEKVITSLSWCSYSRMAYVLLSMWICLQIFLIDGTLGVIALMTFSFPLLVSAGGAPEVYSLRCPLLMSHLIIFLREKHSSVVWAYVLVELAIFRLVPEVCYMRIYRKGIWDPEFILDNWN